MAFSFSNHLHTLSLLRLEQSTLKVKNKIRSNIVEQRCKVVLMTFWSVVMEFYCFRLWSTSFWDRGDLTSHFLTPPRNMSKYHFSYSRSCCSAISKIIIENLCLCKLPTAVTNQFLFSIIWWFNFSQFSFVLTLLFDNLFW